MKEKRKKRSRDRKCSLCGGKEGIIELIEVTIDGVKNRVCPDCNSQLR